MKKLLQISTFLTLVFVSIYVLAQGLTIKPSEFIESQEGLLQSTTIGSVEVEATDPAELLKQCLAGDKGNYGYSDNAGIAMIRGYGFRMLSLEDAKKNGLAVLDPLKTSAELDALAQIARALKVHVLAERGFESEAIFEAIDGETYSGVSETVVKSVSDFVDQKIEGANHVQTDIIGIPEDPFFGGGGICIAVQWEAPVPSDSSESNTSIDDSERLSLAYESGINQDCKSVEPVIVSGFGFEESSQSKDGLLEQAISAALMNAVIAVHGVQIDAERTSQSIYKKTLESTTFEENVIQEINQVFGGFVVSYEELGRINTEGQVNIEIEAQVCADQRIVVLLDGDKSLTDTVTSMIAQNVREVGWTVISNLDPKLQSGDPLDLALATGAKMIARGEVRSNKKSGTSNPTIEADINFRLTNVNTLTEMANYSVASTGVGYSEAEAQSKALGKLSAEVTQKWTQDFLGTEQRLANSITFTNMKRKATRFDIQEMLERTTGVISVSILSYDNETLEIELESSSQLCDIVDEFTSSRRILSQTLDCNNNIAKINILRD